MALINHVPKRSHTLSFHSKTLQNSNEIRENADNFEEIGD